jgi:N-acyl-phosphatidylethanolamine-hydrolysing phospholipase D
MRLAPLGLALALASSGAGCFGARLVGRNAEAFFSTPRPVPNKVTHPVRDDARLAVLWIGHASVLVQIDDRVVLADPLLTPAVGLLARRLIEVGIDPANIPHCDAVVVSHMHQDHLSYGSLDRIESKVGTLIVPDGGLVYVPPDYRFPAVELARWSRWEERGLRITAVPVWHSGFRYGVDDAWMHAYTGYVIEYHGIRVYFGGDTAYDGAAFRETGARFPGIELAILPIAPGRPHGFMKNKHEDPEEAVQAFIDLGAKRMMPMHYDTFVNGDDEWGEPTRVLRAAAARRHVSDRLEILETGEQRVLIAKGAAGQR